MKKHILLATGLAVLSTSAFATKARLEALGGDSGGSYYIKDTRNIFLNPAAVNEYKNYVVTEWGENPNGTTNDAADNEGNPHAEGGFFREAGSFVYGVYMGNNLRDDNAARVAGNGTDTFLGVDNAVDVFLAGNAGMDWGARLHYGKAQNENGTNNQDAKSLGLGLGVQMGAIGVHANLDLTNDSEGSNNDNAHKYEGDFGYDLGVDYEMGSTTFWINYEGTGHKITAGTSVKEDEDTTLEVGAGKTHDVSSSTRIYYSVAFRSTNNKTKVTGGTEDEDKNTNLPLRVGFEAEATSWLTLRGSVSQSIFINKRENKVGATTTETSQNTTRVDAGATLNFGKLKVDGAIGTTGAGARDGILDTDELLARVGVHYWF